MISSFEIFVLLLESYRVKKRWFLQLLFYFFIIQVREFDSDVVCQVPSPGGVRLPLIHRNNSGPLLMLVKVFYLLREQATRTLLVQQCI